MWKNPFQAADAASQGFQQQQNNPPPGPQNNNQNLPGTGTGTGTGGRSALPNNQSRSGTIPDVDNNTPKDNSGVSDDPMLQFENLWQPNKDKDGKVIVDDADDDDTYLPKIDPQKFGPVLEKMDFTRNITPEEWTAVEKGGAESVNAIRGILNKSQRHGFATMMNAMTKLVESGFAKAQGKFSKGVPGIVRDFMTEDGLIGGESTSSIMKNPAFAPMVRQVKNQYLSKFPKASPSEVNSAVKQYFDYMQAELGKGQKPSKDSTSSNQDKLRKGDDTADFMQWIESEVGAQAVSGVSQN